MTFPSEIRQQKIFIVSSSGGQDLAERFMSELKRCARQASKQWTFVPWWQYRPSEHILSTLFAHLKGDKANGIAHSDFCLIFFTPDDQIGSGPRMVPRDNCVFELGLFMGALGNHPERCFVLTSLPVDALPTDLGGFTFLPLLPDAPLQDMKAQLHTAANKVAEAIRSAGAFNPPTFHWIDPDVLWKRERPTDLGGHLRVASSAEVLVKSAQPMEANFGQFALQVKANMAAGVDYKYFFHGRSPLQVIARYFSALVMAGQDPSQQDFRILRDRLRIYLLSNRPPLTVCVHNATVEHEAHCYFRHYNEPKFVEWCDKRDAMEMAEEVKQLCPTGGDEKPAIFQSTSNFAVQQVKGGLLQEIGRALGVSHNQNILDQIEEVCFGKS